MPGRIIAIGDVHGCSAALKTILAAIDPQSDDIIVALGDYVDRGPDSKGVIDLLIALRKTCKVIALHGNHEEMMLDVIRDGKPHVRWLQYGGVETLDSYGFVGDLDVIPPEHFRFFEEMVDFYETERHFFVHANYFADLPLQELDVFTLRWQKLTEQTPAAHFSGKRAFVGHTHDLDGEILDLGHLVCLDTYCYGGGWLTAMDVDAGTIWQADADGILREDADSAAVEPA